MYQCDNCEARYAGEGDLVHVFPDIPDLLARLEPGGTVPAGECPQCGALVYPAEAPQAPRPGDHEPARILILLEGGLVSDVLADRPGVEAAVLNRDIEGLFAEDIESVTTADGALLGTLSSHEATPDAGAIELAFWLLGHARGAGATPDPVLRPAYA